MKINALKKNKYYIQNVYANQMLKPKKQNIQNNAYSENTKNITDYNINQNINFNPKKIFFNKKTVYQNCCPNKSYLLKGNQNFLSQKKANNKSIKKYNEKPLSLGVFTDSTISGRKLNHKNYEIINPFKERSNSENKINSFNRTYTYFNKNDDKNLYKTKQNYRNKKENKKVEKISINLSDISHQNIPTKLYNHINSNEIILNNEKKNISPIKYKNSKKYFYQEKIMKNNNIKDDNNTSYSKLNKKLSNPIMTPLIHKNSNNSSSITSPRNNPNNLKIKNEQNGRIKKYILNNLSDKRKLKSRQCFRQYLPPSAKSSGINNENILNFENNINFNSPRKKDENKFIENVSNLNSPSIPSISSIADDNNNSIYANKKYSWMKINKNNFLYNNKEYRYKNISKVNQNPNIGNVRNSISSNKTLEGFYSNYEKDEKENKEKVVMELSATIIQSVFRGYLIKSKLEAFLYNCKSYNKGLEKLITIFNSFLDKKINILEEKKSFFNNLMILQKQKLFRNNSINNNTSCKTFKLLNYPNSPLSEKDVKYQRYYLDLFLHKEIGERFNIIKENKTKELEKKYKEELDGINNKMNKLIEENNKLKDINDKNKIHENKFKELSMDNKKKDNIINIITNDNQNLAKKLKIIKDKYNKLEIHNQTNMNIFSENNYYNKYKEMLAEYRKLYLLFLINKKKINLYNKLKKCFDKYRNVVKELNNNENINSLLREQKLKNIIQSKRTKEYNYLKNSFIKLYFKCLLKKKEIENKQSIIKSKLINIIKNKEKKNKFILKKYFDKFYYKGIISVLIDEKNEYIINKKKENNEKVKKLFIKIDHRKDKHNFLILRDCFDKWNLLSKILGMKAITDEKKRKKRQKQRMKKKIENKSANKYLTNNNNILNLAKSHNINIINRDKDIISLEHSVTTDFSGGDINGENKIDKIMKATEKLGEFFYKAVNNYKSIDNKNNTLKKNKEVNSAEKEEKINEKEIKENNENEDEYEEDSGDSFGI